MATCAANEKRPKIVLTSIIGLCCGQKHVLARDSSEIMQSGFVRDCDCFETVKARLEHIFFLFFSSPILHVLKRGGR